MDPYPPFRHVGVSVCVHVRVGREPCDRLVDGYHPPSLGRVRQRVFLGLPRPPPVPPTLWAFTPIETPS